MQIKGHLERSSIATIGACFAAGFILACTAIVLITSSGLQAFGSDPASVENYAPVQSIGSQQTPTESTRPATSVRPIPCNALTDIPGRSVTTVIVEFSPSAFTPRHRHPGSVTAFVLKGTLKSQLLGGQAETFKV